ncbi:19956_t:CDS:2, partial [Racocetra persica]
TLLKNTKNIAADKKNDTIVNLPNLLTSEPEAKKSELTSNESKDATSKNKDGRLTFLASFIEPFFEKEGMGPIKKHLVELFQQIELDLAIKQPAF